MQVNYAHDKDTPCIFTVLFVSASFHFIDCPLGCPEIVAEPVNIRWPLEPVTYPESDSVTFV